MTFQEMKEKEEQYLMHTYGRFPIGLVKGEGATVWDTEGKSYVDLNSGIGVNCLGHNHSTLVSALAEQAGKLMHVSNLFYSEPMIQVAEKLVTSSGMETVFFANSGAEANEGMIKLARKYSYDKYGEGRSKIVTLKQSFHGRTVTTLKATGQDKFHQYFFPFTEGFDYAAADDIEDLKAKADETTCAVMVELIQGEGGVLPLDPDYIKAARDYCAEKDILFLVDEIQTGIGRTGSLFCYEQYGIKPDIISMAKGLGGGVPIGAFMAAKSCAEVMTSGTHGTTFGGNPLCCAAANAVLSVVNEPEFLAEVQKKGEYFKSQILSIGSANVKNVRGMGLMLGIIVDADKRAGYITSLIEKGVLAITAGTDAIRLLPPLVITYEEIDRAVAAMKEVFGV